MTGLIYKDALIEILADMQGRCSTKAELKHNSKIWKQVKNMPTVDAVPVIRCKNCRWGKETCGNIECNGEYHGFDWYCANGKRKEE